LRDDLNFSRQRQWIRRGHACHWQRAESPLTLTDFIPTFSKVFGGRCHGRRDDDDDNRRKIRMKKFATERGLLVLVQVRRFLRSSSCSTFRPAHRGEREKGGTLTANPGTPLSHS